MHNRATTTPEQILAEQIEFIQIRYNYLNLTDEQAEQVVATRLGFRMGSDKLYFTDWEEWDHEWTMLSPILNEEQLKTYEAYYHQRIQRHQEGLATQDKEKEREIAYYTAALHFYESQFHPAFFTDPVLMRFIQNSSQRGKIAFLKAEYRQYLVETKTQILTSHFRHSRIYKPNELKASLLQHRLLYIMPDYRSFRHAMDEPTKAIMDFLQLGFQYIPAKIETLYTQQMEMLSAFNKANFEKHYSSMQNTYIAFNNLPPEEKREHMTMTLLLLDEDQYGN